MKLSTMLYIKEQVRKFTEVYDKVIDYFNSDGCHPELVVIKVLLHNFGFDGHECQDWNKGNEERKMAEILRVLESIAKYADSHMENWAYKEVYFIYEGNIMSEMIDE